MMVVAQPKYQLFPDLADEDYQALKRDIRERNVMVPVEYDEDGEILDGHHRDQIWHELVSEGVDLAPYPRIVRAGWTEAQKREHVRRLNLLRRHLTQEQKRELIRDQIRETPERRNRQIATALGVSPTTVGTVRTELEESGDVSKLDTSTDTLGRQQPVHRVTPVPKPTPSSPVRRMTGYADDEDSGICPNCDERFTGQHDCPMDTEDDHVESVEASSDESSTDPQVKPLPHMPPAKPPLNLEMIANERDNDGSVARSRLLHQYSTGIATACSLVLLDAQAVAEALSRERRPIHRENARALRAWLDTVEQNLDRIESRPLQIVGGSRG